MEKRKIYSYTLKGTKKQLDEMQECMNQECYETKTFQKYFYIWVFAGLGRCYFPKEKYFVERDGETHYAIALINYASLHETSDNIMHSSVEIKRGWLVQPFSL